MIINKININEGGLSRLWQHAQGNDDFAIIGSQDKDTREDRSSELYQKLSKINAKYKISWKHLRGSYTYEDGSVGEEKSVIIFGIKKEDALKLGKDLNQETIIWHDDDFFGLLKPNGEVDSKFSADPQNMTFKDVEEFGSRLAHARNINSGKKFAFKLEQVLPKKPGSSITHMLDENAKPRYITLFEKEFK